MSREMKIQEDITRNQHRLTNHLVEQNQRYKQALENATQKLEYATGCSPDGKDGPIREAILMIYEALEDGNLG